MAEPDYEALIVGAGFGGMGVAIQLLRMGIESLLILERASDLGGTWHLNRYPGLSVDIASVTYSYSFEPNPHWSRTYAPGPELEAYARKVADKYDLRRFMRFDSSVETVIYDEQRKLWMVQPADQPAVTARLLTEVRRRGARSFEPDREAAAALVARIRASRSATTTSAERQTA